MTNNKECLTLPNGDCVSPDPCIHTPKRGNRLTKTDKDAIIDALNFVLAGEWDDESHNVTSEQMMDALNKVLEAWR